MNRVCFGWARGWARVAGPQIYSSSRNAELRTQGADGQTFGNSMNVGYVLIVILALSVGAFILRGGQRIDTKLLVCQTSHTRFFSVRHSFSYPLLYVYFQVNNPGTTSFWAVDNWRIFHVRSADYLGSPPCGNNFLEKLKWHLTQHVRPLPFSVLTLGDIYFSISTDIYDDHAAVLGVLF